MAAGRNRTSTNNPCCPQVNLVVVATMAWAVTGRALAPVDAIRQHAEVALARPGGRPDGAPGRDADTTADPGADSDTGRELAVVVLAEGLRAQRLVEDLLLVARVDEHALGTGRSTCPGSPRTPPASSRPGPGRRPRRVVRRRRGDGGGEPAAAWLVERKYYAPGVGHVLTVHVKGPAERVQLVTVTR